MNTYIFGINIIWRSFKYIYMITTISMFMSGPNKAKNGSLVIQTLGETDLKHGMFTQIDFLSNMGRIPHCYTTSH